MPDDVATRLLDRFEEVGLVDDAAFAREWVEQRQSGRGLARRALAQELRRKGIDDEVAREVLDEIDADDEVEAARTLVRAKLRSVRSLDRDKAVRRLVGMLARKGHSSSVGFRVGQGGAATSTTSSEGRARAGGAALSAPSSVAGSAWPSSLSRPCSSATRAHRTDIWANRIGL